MTGIGSHLIVGIPGPELDEATRRSLEALQVGGVILFRRNLQSPNQIARLTAALHQLPSRPLVSIDHEGGRVARLGEPFTRFPPAATVGHSGDVRLAQRLGEAMAAELAAVGIDVDFAPVLDVSSNPQNTVIGDRSFAAEPAVVAALGIGLMRGLQTGGVIPCGKHFPGHGNSAADSHIELPVVACSRAELEQVELVPFRAAIAAAVPILMTAHVLYPALDDEHPATVSRRILHDLLRVELGFKGVIVSDDLQMRAITGRQSVGAAAVASLRAGVDAVLVCQDLDKAVEAHAAITAAVVSGELKEDAIAESGARLRQVHDKRRANEMVACELPNRAHRELVQLLQVASV